MAQTNAVLLGGIFSSIHAHSVDLRVCNQQSCCKTVDGLNGNAGNLAPLRGTRSKEGKKEGEEACFGCPSVPSSLGFLLPSLPLSLGGAVVGGSVRCTEQEEALISCVALFLFSFVPASLVRSSRPRKFVF